MQNQLSRKQHTICNPVSFSGIGVHTGNQVWLEFCPAPVNTGIFFRRCDLPNKPTIPASVCGVSETMRSTTIGKGETRIHTVEHVMAALAALHIDNLYINISNMEPPIGNGSSDTFVKMIDDAGLQEQNADIKPIKVTHPVYFSDKDIHIVALPYDGYKISYTLNYPESEVLRAQFYSVDITPKIFREEIASCRTFSRFEEVSTLMDRGLIKGGSLDNAVIIKDNVVFSREGLRFPNEMARHKVLDIIGDLALIGAPIHAHVIAIRSGHAANHELAKKIKESFTLENQ